MANIKLTGHTWDTSGVWDATEEKTQAQSNAAKNAAIAPTQASTTASSKIDVGSRFWLAGVLYIATADIAQGATIVTSGTGQNCKPDVLGADVSELKDALLTIGTMPLSYNIASSVFTISAQKGRLDYTDGHISTDEAYTIYLLTFAANGTITLEKTATNGLLGAVLYSQELETISSSSSTASTYFVEGGRSDKTGTDALPTSESPWNVTTGQMLAIYAQKRTYPKIDFNLAYNKEINVFSNDVYFNTTQVREVKDIADRKPIIKYGDVDTDIGSRGKEQITVFLPTVNGYIKYAFVRCEYDDYNANNWRIDRCYACNVKKEVLFPITNEGEWEMAIQIDGAPDFIGGNAHGDEVLVAFNVLIDGVPVDDVTEITEQECDTINIVETTSLYNPSDGATLSTRGQFTPVGTHGREYIITKDSIRLKQEVTFDTALTLGASYMTMLPILRGNDTASAEQITDHYFADNNFTIYDVSVGESGGAGYGWKHNVTLATIWGEDSGISATVEMLKQPDIENAGARMFKVQDTLNSYNKFYWSVCGVDNNDYSASANERFVTDTLYKISAKSIS